MTHPKFQVPRTSLDKRGGEGGLLLLRHETHFLFTGDPSLTSPCPLFSQFSTFSKITTHEDVKKMITTITRPAGKEPEKCQKVGK